MAGGTLKSQSRGHVQLGTALPADGELPAAVRISPMR